MSLAANDFADIIREQYDIYQKPYREIHDRYIYHVLYYKCTVDAARAAQAASSNLVAAVLDRFPFDASAMFIGLRGGDLAAAHEKVVRFADLLLAYHRGLQRPYGLLAAYDPAKFEYAHQASAVIFASLVAKIKAAADADTARRIV